MTTHQKELYITMVEMFIEHYPDDSIGTDGKPYLDCHMCRAWQAMRADLIALGLAEGHPLSSSLSATVSQARQRLATNMPASAPPFQEILDDWMYLFSGYHSPTLPTTRGPFATESVYAHVMALFVSHGFARKEAEKYIWTEKIAPAMRSFYQWTPELEDLGDLETQEIDQALASVPKEIETRILETGDPFKSLRIIKELWDGEVWHLVPAKNESSNAITNAQMRLYRRMIERATGSSPF
ncbi:MAG: hypothetical protein HWE25_15745 [Alphaproteobacteria bacterium]|nr:hypothetical protein [Alphaproteobacteria bacterium]